MSFGESFLVEPDLFPARLSGEVWGPVEIELEVPGGPYRIAGLTRGQADQVAARFGTHCRILERAVTGSATLATVFRAAATDFRHFDLRGWEYRLDTDPSPTAVRLAGLDLCARLDWRPELRGALWTPDDGGPAFPGIFENFCRVLVAYRLLECGGAVLHSAGVERNGRGFVFVGRSGAGKTTVSRASLAAGATVLSDDLNALVPSPHGTLVAKLPFTGDLGTREVVSPYWPLAALLRLEKSDSDELAPLSRGAALAHLFACSPFVNTDPHRTTRLLDNLAALLPVRHVYRLRFALGGTFWSILDRKWQQSTEGAS
jgi:hypothetical protein